MQAHSPRRVLRPHALPPCLQVRASSISEQPLTSIALLPVASGSSKGGGGGAGQRHPLVLCGSYDARVHTYSADYGRHLGSWQAAGDAVACLQLVGSGAGSSSGGGSSGGGGSGERLVSASWDGSIKIWDLGEGRQPWDASFCQPLATLTAPSSVWALAASLDGRLLLAGECGGQMSHSCCLLLLRLPVEAAAVIERCHFCLHMASERVGYHYSLAES